MDAKAAKQVNEKGFKYTFWDEIAGAEKKMPAEQSKKVSIALKSFQRLGISQDGKVDPKRLEDANEAANIVAALDAVEEPMGKIYKELKSDKHWKKAIENYGVMLTTVRSLAEPKAAGGTGQAPTGGGAMFAVADVVPTLNTVAKALEQIQTQLSGMEQAYSDFADVLGSVDEPGANLDVVQENGLAKLQDVARLVMVMSKTFGDVKGPAQKLAAPKEINPTDKNLNAYTAKYTSTVKVFKEVGTAIAEEKAKLVDNQKLLKTAVSSAKSQQQQVEDNVNENLMQHQHEDDPDVIKSDATDAIKANDTAYKLVNKMRALYYTLGDTQSEIEAMTAVLLDLPDDPQQKIQQLKGLTPDIKQMGTKVQSAGKSVTAAEQGLKLLAAPDRLNFNQDSTRKDYEKLYNSAPQEVKRAKDAAKKAADGFRGVLDTVTQVKQVALASQ